MPESTQLLFWDVNVYTLDLAKHSNYIITRILEKGRILDLRWLFSTYSAKQINKVITSSANITATTAAFWKLVFN